MKFVKAGAFALSLLTAGLLAPATRAAPLDSIVTPAMSIVLSGSSVQTLQLLQVFTPTGAYWALLGVDGCGGCAAPPEYGVAPRPISVELASSSVAGGTIGIVQATYDLASFAFGVSDITIGLRWAHTEPFGPSSYIYTSHVARVMRMFDLTTIGIVTPIKLDGSLFGFRPPRTGTPVDAVDVTISWGDGKTTTVELAVLDGVVRIPTDLHDYDRPGRYTVALSYALNGETYGLSTTVDVPGPSALLLLATGIAGLGGALRFRRNTRNTRATRR